jgi:release factor glutamine methyltransferase
LIPRPETELLVEDALAWVQEQGLESPRILDLGCGTGCIGISLLHKIPGAQLVGVDKSPEALELAKKNSAGQGLGERARWLESDVLNLQFEAESFDLILANPPYISLQDPDVQSEVRKFEPHLALFSEDEGLFALRSWSEKARHWLKPKSYMGFEMGWTQSPEMQRTFESFQAFQKVKIIKDLAGLNRHIVGVKNG